jgi:cytoskeletal protein CcmA (bactofilin family)
MPAMADDNAFEFGGDWYGGGQNVSVSSPVAGDVFATGYDVNIDAVVGGDAHMAGFNTRVTAPVTGNVYAGGFSVLVDASVGQDVSAAGNSVDIKGEVAGNVRATGAFVTIAGPVSGSVLAAGDTVTLSGTIGGDAEITATHIKFGDGAMVGGNLILRSSEDVEVPASVAPASRVSFERIEEPQAVLEQTNVGVKVMTSPWVWFFGGIVWVGFLLVVGLILLALFPRRTERVQQVAIAKPWYSLLSGGLGLAMLLGLVPVLGMTLVGIPLIPVLFLLLALLWIVTYLMGGFILGERIMSAFGRHPLSLPAKMLTLAVGLVLVWVVGLIPLIGWLAVEALMFLALGAIILSVTLRWFDPALRDKLNAPAS